MNLYTELDNASILALRIKHLAIAATEIAMEPIRPDHMGNSEIISSITESIKHCADMLSEHLDSMDANMRKAANTKGCE